ncbi:MAG: ABC transporter permease [Candidatus Dormibacteraeota bacterium]|nr:ABC transporter permease [Candidatus Dormibacteraeota bacterium]
MDNVPTDGHLPLSLETLSGAPAPARASRWAGQLDVVIPAAVIVLVFGACFIWPALFPLPKPVGGSIFEANLRPLSPGHVLGTDPVGNDVLSRLLYGGRASLETSLAVNLIGLVLGGTIGALAGYLGGAADAVAMRALDVLIAFPALVLALAIADSLGPGQGHTILALSFFTVPIFARNARAATLRLRELTFMTAARLCGTRTWRMLLRHIAPNILPQLVTFGLLSMGTIMVIEGALSFLGLGIALPNPSWGNMIFQGQQSISATPLLVLFPSAFLFVAVLAFNLVGDALRARWNLR